MSQRATIFQIFQNRIISMTTNFSAVSLFTGAGGMDVGFTSAGFDVVWANELMPHAAATYELNHRPGVMHVGDINKVLDSLPIGNEIACVFGGPPCQGFSVAGKMDLTDERSKLVFAYMQVVSRVRPTSFVLENVKALATLSKFAAIREELVRQAHANGYNAQFYLLNAKDFGVPQNRERVFFIGFKRSLNIIFNAQCFDQYKKPTVTVRSLLEKFGPAGTEKNPKTCVAKITLAANPVMRKSPYAGMLFNGAGRPINTDGISGTLPASMGGNKTPIIDEAHVFQGQDSWVETYHSALMKGQPPLGMNDAPISLRRLTVREAAAIQTFPENYRFFGPISSHYTQIGNAVPCRLAEAVALAVRDALQLRTRLVNCPQAELELSSDY
jgi:DNA (cytosine-5)-methyltransferase 1